MALILQTNEEENEQENKSFLADLFYKKKK